MFPLCFTHEERDWNLEFNVDKTEKRFSLKLNSRPFLDLPEEAISQSAVILEEGSLTISGTIEFNEVSLLKGEMSWSIPAMQKLVRRKLRGKPITRVRFNRISCTEDVMNELMEFTVDNLGDDCLQ